MIATRPPVWSAPQVRIRAAAALELRRRKAAPEHEGGYEAWYRTTLPPGWDVPPHIAYLCRLVDDLVAGRIQRLCVSMPPGHAKSDTLTRRLPLYWAARHPKDRIVVTGYNQTFANRQLSLAARELARERGELAADATALDEWGFASGARLIARGVGSAPTGVNPISLLIVDDPIKDRAQAASAVERENVWAWWQGSIVQRFWPRTRALVIACMAGDTPVLMEDGSEKPLREIRPGDRIATYEDGGVAVSTVRDWINQGPDIVYWIRMKSGTSVRANARHPFLAQTDQGLQWQRTASLEKGTRILRATGASGTASPVQPRDATSLRNAQDSVCPTTARSGGPTGIGRLLSTLIRAAGRSFAIATRSKQRTTTGCLPNRADSARFAGAPPTASTPQTGGTTSPSIIATTPAPSGGFSATTATSSSDAGGAQRCCSPPLSIYGFEADEVVEVVEAGYEDVFDIEVERTANFIAGGLVSHNTRWHENDLIGRLEAQEAAKPPGERTWTFVNLPALAGPDDPLGREEGEALWPAAKPAAFLHSLRAEMGPYEFEALFQGRPTPRDGSLFAVTKLRYCDAHEVPPLVRVCRAWDLGGGGAGSDATAGVKIGQDAAGRTYVLDARAARYGPGERNAWMRATAEEDGAGVPIRLPQDPGQAGKEQSAALVRLFSGFAVTSQPVTGSKEVRATPYAAQMEAGNVTLVRGPWNAAFVEELRAFPAGAHDDLVDAAADAFNAVGAAPTINLRDLIL